MAVIAYVAAYPVALDLLTAHIAGTWSMRPEIENWADPAGAAQPGAARLAGVAAVLATVSVVLLGHAVARRRRAPR
jgi:hypothetical protein